MIEFSEDRRRGAMPHIAKAIEQVRGAITGQTCRRCGAPGSHLVNARRTPQVVCERCKDTWVRMAPIDRLRGRW